MAKAGTAITKGVTVAAKTTGTVAKPLSKLASKGIEGALKINNFPSIGDLAKKGTNIYTGEDSPILDKFKQVRDRLSLFEYKHRENKEYPTPERKEYTNYLEAYENPMQDMEMFIGALNNLSKL